MNDFNSYFKAVRKQYLARHSYDEMVRAFNKPYALSQVYGGFLTKSLPKDVASRVFIFD